jgi:hypothetical protein
VPCTRKTGRLFFAAVLLNHLTNSISKFASTSPPFALLLNWQLTPLAVLVVLALGGAFYLYYVKRLKQLDAALSASQQLTEQLKQKQIELSRLNQKLALDAAITHILVEAATPNEAAPRILRVICERLGWEWSALWDVDKEANVLRCASVWRPQGTAALSFEATTRQQVFAPGVGLPGRVLATRQAHWIEDLSRDKNFPRIEAALAEGLCSGLGFILLGSEVIAVIEFFSRTPRRPQREQLQMLAALRRPTGPVDRTQTRRRGTARERNPLPHAGRNGVRRDHHN